MSVSDLYDDAVQVKRPVMFRELSMSCNSESTSAWHLRTFPLVKSARMYAQVHFGNYLFKLFKKCMSKHPYQYFVWRFQFFKMYVLNLNCKLTLQSLLFFCLFSKCQIRPRPKPQFWFVPQFAKIILFHWSAEVGHPIYREWSLFSSKTYCVDVHPFSQSNPENVAVVH